jgi:hypothetical protein
MGANERGEPVRANFTPRGQLMVLKTGLWVPVIAPVLDLGMTLGTYDRVSLS